MEFLSPFVVGVIDSRTCHNKIESLVSASGIASTINQLDIKNLSAIEYSNENEEQIDLFLVTLYYDEYKQNSQLPKRIVDLVENSNEHNVDAPIAIILVSRETLFFNSNLSLPDGEILPTTTVYFIPSGFDNHLVGTFAYIRNRVGSILEFFDQVLNKIVFVDKFRLHHLSLAFDNLVAQYGLIDCEYMKSDVVIYKLYQILKKAFDQMISQSSEEDAQKLLDPIVTKEVIPLLVGLKSNRVSIELKSGPKLYSSRPAFISSDYCIGISTAIYDIFREIYKPSNW
jgi:hypothetical protein